MTFKCPSFSIFPKTVRCSLFAVFACIGFSQNVVADSGTLLLSYSPSIADSYVMDFRGEPVHSFYPNRHLLFSLDDEGQLWKYTQFDKMEWRVLTLEREGVKQASVGVDFLLVLYEDGTLMQQSISEVTTDAGYQITLGEEATIATGVKSIAAGYDHYLFITETGVLMGAGYDAGDGRFAGNVERQLTIPVQLATSVKAASAGQGFSLYITENGTLWAMGTNHYGHLGTGDYVPVYSPRAIAQNVKKVQGERNATWFTTESNELYWMGKQRATGPTAIAGEAVTAAMDPQTSRILWVDSQLQQILSAPLSDQAYPSGHSMGSGRAVTALSGGGFLMIRNGYPLFRFVSPGGIEELGNPFQWYSAGKRFMTLAPSEISIAHESLAWDGINHFVEVGPVNGAKPVYRFFHTFLRSHLYTQFESEIASLEQSPGWIKEGVAFYAWDYPVEGSQPVYRFYSPVTASHYYTIGDAHKNELLANPTDLQFQYEGIAYWAYSFFGPQ